MDNDLSPLTVFLAVLFGSVTGMMRDPVTIALCCALVAVGFMSRAWWSVVVAAVGRTAFIFYHNWDWWQSIGVDRDALDFARLTAIALIPFGISFVLGRLLSRLRG